MKSIILSLTILMLSYSSFSQTEIGDVELPNTLKSGSTEIKLNGGGIREKYFLDIYVGGLYLTFKSSNADEIIKKDDHMGIRLHMVSSLIDSEKMISASNEGFQKSTKGNTKTIQKHIDAFINVFKKEAISDGDIYNIIYTPGTGVLISKNGKLVETINGGLEFKKALFGIWLCDEPADEDLKEGMLGLD